MKVLRVIRSLHPSGGGPIEGLKQSAPFFRNCGVDFSVACLDPPESTWLTSLPFQTIPLGPVFGSYGYRPGLPSALSAVGSGFDAVIVEGLWQYHALAAWRAFHSSSLPYYVFIHGMLDPWFKTAYPLKHLKKLIYWSLVEHRLLTDASGVLFTTNTERDLAHQSFHNYRGNDFVVGFGASEPPEISTYDITSFYSRYPSLIGKQIFLFLGRLHPKKGVDLLIRGFADVVAQDRSCHLVLAGPVDRDYYRHLISIVRSLGLDSQVTWTGPLFGPIKWAAFRVADLFCLPSHQENFGVAVAEALSVGLPVCISSSVNISDLVAQAGAGLVHPDTLTGTSVALLRWLQTSSAIRSTMSESALQLFQSQFQWDRVTQRLADLLYGRIA